MLLKYLGTAAAEGWPAVFCRCDNCNRARIAGGRNIRTRSQALIDGKLLIDFPADSYCHMLWNNIDFSAVTNLLITHNHVDHLDPLDLSFRTDSCFCHDRTEKTLDIYGSDSVCETFARRMGNGDGDPEDPDTHLHLLPPYTPTQIGDYTVTAMKAYHAAPSTAYVFHISNGKRSMLYLHDTGRLFDEVYDYMIANKLTADLVSFDCTYVALPSGGGHMGLDSNVVERDRLRENGIIGQDTKLVVNHFSHNGGLIYDELVPVAEKLGFITSYDGMEIEV